MAVVTVSIETTLSKLWNDPNQPGVTWQIITGWESYTNRLGEVKKRKWSLWSNQTILEIGENDFLTVTGDLSTKVETWQKDGETKNVVGHSLESFTVSKHDTSKRRGGDLNGIDQDDVRKYGHTAYGAVDGTAGVEAPF
jgi:hypothetical protein